MFNARRRGFGWKEVAKALHVTRVLANTTFWREIKGLNSKKVESQPPASLGHKERDPDRKKIANREHRE